MNPLLLQALILAFITASIHCDPIDTLDLRVVSQLRFELRNIAQAHDQCEVFWKELSDKLDEAGAHRATRDATLRKVKVRLNGLRNFEKLASFVDKCISEKDELASSDEPTGINDRVKVLNAKLEELQRELQNKDEKIRQLTLNYQKESSQDIGAGKSELECSKVNEELLETLRNEMEKLKVESNTKDEKLERMRLAKESAIEKLNELAKNLGGHASQLVQEKDFAEQQVKELRNSLTNSAKDYELKLRDKQEQMEKFKVRVHQLESELRTNILELSRLRQESEAKMRPNLNEVKEQNGRRFIKIHVY